MIFFNLGVGNWLWEGVKSHKFASFVAGIWWMWRKRNAQILAQEDIPLFKLKMEVIKLANIIYASKRPPHDATPPRMISWHSSREDVTVLNVDGSSIGNLGRSRFGGLPSRRDNS